MAENNSLVNKCHKLIAVSNALLDGEIKPYQTKSLKNG